MLVPLFVFFWLWIVLLLDFSPLSFLGGLTLVYLSTKKKKLSKLFKGIYIMRCDNQKEKGKEGENVVDSSKVRETPLQIVWLLGRLEVVAAY